MRIKVEKSSKVVLVIVHVGCVGNRCRSRQISRSLLSI